LPARSPPAATIAAHYAARARGEVRDELAETLLNVGSGAADTDGAPPVTATSDAAARKAMQWMAREIRWTDDGNCYSRALRGAAMLLENGGRDGTTADARSAAIAVVSGPFPNNKTWPFHAAVAYRSASGDVRIIDRLSSSRDMSVGQWARSNGVAADRVHFVSPTEAKLSFTGMSRPRGSLLQSSRPTASGPRHGSMLISEPATR
ncbi:MAG: hypothetical protein JWN41_1545, partial [Thermoleophilia bacterium]|nr:hypothetical protein [Thermoleophilia bacterium]